MAWFLINQIILRHGMVLN